MFHGVLVIGAHTLHWGTSCLLIHSSVFLSLHYATPHRFLQLLLGRALILILGLSTHMLLEHTRTLLYVYVPVASLDLTKWMTSSYSGVAGLSPPATNFLFPLVWWGGLPAVSGLSAVAHILESPGDPDVCFCYIFFRGVFGPPAFVWSPLLGNLRTHNIEDSLSPSSKISHHKHNIPRNQKFLVVVKHLLVERLTSPTLEGDKCCPTIHRLRKPLAPRIHFQNQNITDQSSTPRQQLFLLIFFCFEKYQT